MEALGPDLKQQALVRQQIAASTASGKRGGWRSLAPPLLSRPASSRAASAAPPPPGTSDPTASGQHLLQCVWCLCLRRHHLSTRSFRGFSSASVLCAHGLGCYQVTSIYTVSASVAESFSAKGRLFASMVFCRCLITHPAYSNGLCGHAFDRFWNRNRCRLSFSLL